MISNCRSVYSSNLCRYSRVEFVRRQANKIVHVLASFHLFIDIYKWIRDIIINEMLQLFTMKKMVVHYFF
jgi:hypothetical protein